jgi:hypothetical protein
MTGVASKDICIGDMIYQFPGPQYPPVVRKKLDYYEIILKSINCDPILLFATNSDKRKKPKAHDSQGQHVRFYTGRPVLLYFRDLFASELDIKESTDTRALGRTFTGGEPQEEYSYRV